MMAKKTLLAVMPGGGETLPRLVAPKNSVLTRTEAAWKMQSALLYLHVPLEKCGWQFSA
jgi:hypothetical protein